MQVHMATNESQIVFHSTAPYILLSVQTTTIQKKERENLLE
jgi:hypothetical protein